MELADDLQGDRGGDRPPLSWREVADRHHRRATRSASHDGPASARTGWRRPKGRRPAAVDCRSVVPFIVEQLEKYPGLRASRLFVMIKERGYPGSADHLRRVVSRLRPKKPAEAFQRLRTMPGEQAQVDWAHFGKLEVGARSVRFGRSSWCSATRAGCFSASSQERRCRFSFADTSKHSRNSAVFRECCSTTT